MLRLLNYLDELVFGTGVHVCLGLKLAKAEAEIALQNLFTRFPDVRLGVDEHEIRWGQRVGLRSIHQLPVKLHE